MTINDIERTIELYISGCYEADEAKLRQAFYENSYMDGVIDHDIYSMTSKDYIGGICTGLSMKERGIHYTYVVDSISVSAFTACVAIREYGFNGSSNYKTFFHLINTPNGWKIYHKLFEGI